MIQIFRDNKTLLQQMPDAVLQCVVGFLDFPHEHRAGYLRLLSEICCCAGEGVPKIQNFICETVLAPKGPCRLRDLVDLRLEGSTVYAMLFTRPAPHISFRTVWVSHSPDVMRGVGGTMHNAVHSFQFCPHSFTQLLLQISNSLSRTLRRCMGTRHAASVRQRN